MTTEQTKMNTSNSDHETPQGGKCCLCEGNYEGWGHNPYPLVEEEDYESRCCDHCNATRVIPTRIRQWCHDDAKAKLKAKIAAKANQRKRR
jgi:hypothetical protein